MVQEEPFHIYPIAESAITIEYGKEISIAAHQELLKLQKNFHKNPFNGFRDTTITYNSLTVFFDPPELYREGQYTPLAFVLQEIQTWLTTRNYLQESAEQDATRHLIPVCYEIAMGPDLQAVAAFHNTSPEQLIEAHCAQDWYVFMIGFNPGFAYMGLLPDTLAMPRKATPALQVPAGSVGIAGRQTGIYPNNSPGGWQIIGRSPISIFNPSEAQPSLFKAGDTVRFTQIDSATFQYLNQHANS